jgi:hypothetical protein
MLSCKRSLLMSAILALTARAALSQAAPSPAPKADTDYQAMQQRGEMVMGVDQYTSTHVFDDLANGGRIELQAAPNDTAGVAKIRKHMHEVAAAFKAGDFTSPELVHGQDSVPGTAVMRAKRPVITYTVRDLPRGAEILIASNDPAAVAAIHDFLAFQRSAHHAGGMTH